ncbi:hypothetical protein ACOME3_000721 [Neoechinorhynchus agilis]
MEPHVRKIKADVESIVRSELPKKISESCELCEDPQAIVYRLIFSDKHRSDAISRGQIVEAYVDRIVAVIKNSQEPNPDAITKKANLAAIEFPANSKLREIEDLLRPFVTNICDICNEIKLWIQLHVPKVEDGHNFGVGVQEDVLSEVTQWDDRISQFHEFVQNYYLARALLVKKYLKFPQIEDFRLSIVTADEKQFIDLRHYAILIRECYITMHRSITLNIEKIKHPRPQSNSNMY